MRTLLRLLVLVLLLPAAGVQAAGFGPDDDLTNPLGGPKPPSMVDGFAFDAPNNLVDRGNDELAAPGGSPPEPTSPYWQYGNYCSTPYGRVGPGEWNLIGQPCRINWSFGVVPGVVTQ